MQSIVMSMSVCPSVRFSTCVTRKPQGRTSQFFVHVASGHGSVLLWQLCSTLCTYGFVGDVSF